jgi:hypothetical protein
MKTIMKTIKFIFHALFVSCFSHLQLFAAPDLIGEWTTTFGRYEETLTFKADGKYQQTVNVVRGPTTNQSNKSTGTWKLNGDELERTTKDGTDRETIRFVSPTKFECPSPLGADGVLVYEKTRSLEKAAVASSAKVTEPKPGSPERKAIMDSMRAPVSKYAKKEVLFTGSVSVCGTWAKFEGHVGSKDGKRFAADLEDELSLDFLAVLQKVDGIWRTLYYGWSGDIQTHIEAREKLPDVPEALVPKLQTQ